MTIGQAAYSNATSSVAGAGVHMGDAGFLAKKVGKGLSEVGGIATAKHKENEKAAKEEAKAAKQAEKAAAKKTAARSASAKKGAETRKANAAPKPGRSAVAVAASKYVPEAAKATKAPRKRAQSSAVKTSFTSATGGSPQASNPTFKRPVAGSDIIHSSGIDPATAYND